MLVLARTRIIKNNQTIVPRKVGNLEPGNGDTIE